MSFKDKNIYVVVKSYLKKKAYLNKDKHKVLENVTVLAGMCKIETKLAQTAGICT
jgi:hypothetical protein